jgi:hypothetical protein
MNRSAVWTHPNLTIGEGPCKFGLENPYCNDLAGGHSRFITCRRIKRISPQQRKESGSVANNKKTEPVFTYGGYFSVEFSRDVELQTPEFRTTQENVAAYISKTFNTDALVEDFGKPICVANTGVHDAMIPNITLAKYVTNVEWYLHLLKAQCRHVIWISTTAPATNKFIQTSKQTKEWDAAVKQMISASTTLRPVTSFVDVFSASARTKHADNIHMTQQWYNALGNLFLALM